MQGESRRRVETIAWVSFYQIELHLAGVVLSLMLGLQHRTRGRGEARNGHGVRILISRWLLPPPPLPSAARIVFDAKKREFRSSLSRFPRLFFRDPPTPPSRRKPIYSNTTLCTLLVSRRRASTRNWSIQSPPFSDRPFFLSSLFHRGFDAAWDVGEKSPRLPQFLRRK